MSTPPETSKKPSGMTVKGNTSNVQKDLSYFVPNVKWKMRPCHILVVTPADAPAAVIWPEPAHKQANDWFLQQFQYIKRA
jgi:hypothetical protein